MSQAKSAKHYLSKVNFSNIYSSPLKRALNTAKIIAEGTGHEVRVMNDLKEIDFGKWEGLKFDEINTMYKEDYQGWLEDPYNHPPTGGESFNDLIARADKEIKKIVQENPDGSSVAIVSHGGVILSLIVNWLGIPSGKVALSHSKAGCNQCYCYRQWISIYLFHKLYRAFKTDI